MAYTTIAHNCTDQELALPHQAHKDLIARLCACHIAALIDAGLHQDYI